MVNNDTELPPGMIDTFLSTAHALNADISSPLIFYGGQPEKVWSAGGDFCRLLSAPLDAHHRNKPIPKEPVRRGFLTGCALLIHRNAFEKIGFFDDTFFLYYEDLDFLKRANDSGLEIWLIPQAKLFHHESTSSQGLESEKVVYWMAFSSCRYFLKHAKIWQWIFIVPWRVLHSIKRIIQFISNKKSNLIRPYILGSFSINRKMNQQKYSE